MAKKQLEIVNEKGLHARASAKFVEVVEDHDASVTVRLGDEEADGSSIMSLLMLLASKGSFIEIETNGPDSEALADALEALVTDRFGEEA